MRQQVFAWRTNGEHAIIFPKCHPARRSIFKKVLASLSTICPKCGHAITPAEITRVSWEEIECPACRVRFDPAKSKASSLIAASVQCAERIMEKIDRHSCDGP